MSKHRGRGNQPQARPVPAVSTDAAAPVVETFPQESEEAVRAAFDRIDERAKSLDTMRIQDECAGQIEDIEDDLAELVEQEPAGGLLTFGDGHSEPVLRAKTRVFYSSVSKGTVLAQAGEPVDPCDEDLEFMLKHGLIEES